MFPLRKGKHKTGGNCFCGKQYVNDRIGTPGAGGW